MSDNSHQKQAQAKRDALLEEQRQAKRDENTLAIMTIAAGLLNRITPKLVEKTKEGWKIEWNSAPAKTVKG
jgi:hypothetical protein